MAKPHRPHCLQLSFVLSVAEARIPSRMLDHPAVIAPLLIASTWREHCRARVWKSDAIARSGILRRQPVRPGTTPSERPSGRITVTDETMR
jgi:hypothetical protein